MVSSSFTPLALQRVDRGVQVGRAQRDVLDALAVVHVQVLLDLAGLLVAFFVDRDADLAAGAGHGLALDAGDLALDVEVADLAEVEQPLVEVGPLGHAAAVHVVRQVVDVGQAVAGRVQRFAHRAGSGSKSTSKKPMLPMSPSLRAVLAAPAVDEIDQAVADALDGRDVQLARPGRAGVTPGAQRDRALVGRLGVLHAEGDGADARPVRRAKRCANESGSALTMKLISPWRYSITFLWRCRAIGLKPMRSNSAPMAAGSGAAYSMNSKPSVPMGLSQGVNCMAVLSWSRLMHWSVTAGSSPRRFSASSVSAGQWIAGSE